MIYVIKTIVIDIIVIARYYSKFMDWSISAFAIVFHHWSHYLSPFLLDVLSLLFSVLLLSLSVQSSQQHTPFIFFFSLGHARVRIIICPLNSNYLTAIQSLICHGFLGELCHTSVPVLDKCVALVRQNVDILDISPESEVPENDLVKLGDTIIIVGQLVVTYIDGSGLLGKGPHTFHILPKWTKPSSTENILILVNALTVINARHPMVIFAVNPIGAAPSGVEQAEECCMLVTK